MMSGKASPEVLLATYLGRDVARRVLSGETSRGHGRLVRAGIFYADLKGFTTLTDRLPAEQVIGHLNDYFDIVATSVLEHNGEVLKFIGDGACSRPSTSTAKAPRAPAAKPCTPGSMRSKVLPRLIRIARYRLRPAWPCIMATSFTAT